MTITVTQSPEKQIEVTLPYYSKDSIGFTCIKSDVIIRIELSGFEASIRNIPSGTGGYNAYLEIGVVNSEKITEKEFNKAYRLALIKLYPDYLQFEELKDTVDEKHTEDDTQNGMIRIGEWVCNFLGLGQPLTGFLVSSIPQGMIAEKIEGEGKE